MPTVDTRANEAKTFEQNKRAAELENFFRRKKESEKKALTIVERLLEDNVPDEFFVDSAKFINPDFYNDVVTERSIGKICGYPLCNNPLRNVPKQKFHISMKTNKVYDITERKNYCSQWCFQASTYFKNQLSTSQLWEREREAPPVVTLLQKTEKCATNHDVDLQAGVITRAEVEVLQRDAVVPLSPEKDVKEVLPADDILTNKAGSQQRERELYRGVSQTNAKRNEPVKISRENSGNSLKSVPYNEVICNKLEAMSVNPEQEISKNHNTEELQSCVTPSEDGTSYSNEHCVTATHHSEHSTSSRKDDSVERPLDSVLIRLSEYMTPLTKEFFSSSCNASESRTVGSSDAASEQKGVDLSSVVIVGQNRVEGEHPHNLKKLPDFSQLQKDAELQQLKVREFLDGTFKYPTQISAGPVKETAYNEGEELSVGKEGRSREGAESVKKTVKSAPHTIPPIDSHSQTVIQRKIFLEHVHKCFPDILPPLGLSIQDISTELRVMVTTFRFTSQNIVMKPTQWKQMTALLLMLIGRRAESVMKVLLSQHAQEFLSTTLAKAGFSLDGVNHELDVILTFQHLAD